MGETYRRTNITATLHQYGLDGKVTKLKLLLSKDTWNLQKYTQITLDYGKKKWLSGLMNLNSLFMSEGNQALLITCIIPSQRWSMVVAASCSGGGGVSVAGTGEVIREDGKLNAAKYREILNENLVQSTQNLRLGWKFTFQHDNHPPHTAKTMQEWLRDSMNVLEWPSQSWDLEPIRQIWRNL